MAKSDPTLNYTEIDHNKWHFCLAATDSGLAYVGAGECHMDEMTVWVGSNFTG